MAQNRSTQKTHNMHVDINNDGIENEFDESKTMLTSAAHSSRRFILFLYFVHSCNITISAVPLNFVR